MLVKIHLILSALEKLYLLYNYNTLLDILSARSGQQNTSSSFSLSKFFFSCPQAGLYLSEMEIKVLPLNTGNRDIETSNHFEPHYSFGTCFLNEITNQ